LQCVNYRGWTFVGRRRENYDADEKDGADNNVSGEMARRHRGRMWQGASDGDKKTKSNARTLKESTTQGTSWEGVATSFYLPPFLATRDLVLA
jgi:hypothetical protein